MGSRKSTETQQIRFVLSLFSVQFFLLRGDRVSIVPVLWNPNSTTSQVKSRLQKMPQAWINAKGLLFVA
jgi:hypothetical protein